MDISQNYPNITDLSNELLCNILKYLPLREALSIAMLCRKLLAAVDMHLRLCKSIDFCQDSVYGYMPGSITDDHMHALFKKCPHLETVYGLHPIKVERRRLRKRSALTVPGIIEALSLCYHLKAVETSDLRLFEAIMQHLPQIEIIGHFQNRDGVFPPNTSQKLRLQPYPRITSLHLIGVELPELTAMPHVQHLHLQCVRFTKLQPFRLFLAHNLKSFVMKHCMGPTMSLRYLSLIIALSSSPNLSHLELIRVPLPGGLFQRAVEDSHRHQGFVNLRTLVIGGCKGMLEADIGHLMIVSSKNLETLYIQPSLTKDSLFVSLSYAQCSFPSLRNLHLGYVDTLNSSGEWSEEALLSLGLAEVPDTPSSITDSGMKVISELFPHIKTMSVSNCPHLMVMYQWLPGEGLEAWSELTDLTLQKCHCLQLSSFALFLSLLPCIQVVILRDMFREPPKGCSHVGLSAGTGLGMSSAVVSNQDEHIAVQGHHQDFDHPGEEENEENEREFLDVENEDNQEPHFMVLQRDFFDGEDDDIDGAGEGLVDNLEGAEQDRDEGFNIYENQPDDNPHSYQEINNNDSDASDNNYDPSRSSSSRTTNNKATCTKSKYHLRQTPKRLARSTKSVGVQADVSMETEHHDQSSNTNPLIAKEMLLDSEDSYSSNNIKNPTVCDKVDSSYSEYDPCKPSTSKAGRSLDFMYSSDSKSYNMSDSEVDIDNKFDNKPKRLKRQYSSEEEVQKESFVLIDDDSLSVGANLSVKSEQDIFPDSGERNCHSRENTSEDSDIELLNVKYEVSPSLYNDYKLSKPCHVVISKLDNKYSSDVKVSENPIKMSNAVRPVKEINISAAESDSLTSETFSFLSHTDSNNSSEVYEIIISSMDKIPKDDMHESSEMLIDEDSTKSDWEIVYKKKQSTSVNDESLPDTVPSYVVTELENKGNIPNKEIVDHVKTQKLSRDCSLRHNDDEEKLGNSYQNHEQDSVTESKNGEIDKFDYCGISTGSKKVMSNECSSKKSSYKTLKLSESAATCIPVRDKKRSFKHSENQFSKTSRHADVKNHENTPLKQSCGLSKENDSIFDDEKEMSKMSSCHVLINKIEADTLAKKEVCRNSSLYDPSQPSTSKAANHNESSCSQTEVACSIIKDESCSSIKDESESTCDQHDHSNKVSNSLQHTNEIAYSSDNSVSEDYASLYVCLKRVKDEDRPSSSSDSEYEVIDDKERNCEELQPVTSKADDKCDMYLPSTSKSNSMNYISDSVEESSNPPRTKKQKKPLKNQYSNESDFYIQIPNNTSESVKIVNSHTGVSYKTASCSVVLHRSHSRKKHSSSKVTDIHESSTFKKSRHEQSGMYDYNSSIPSTSKAGISLKSESESSDVRNNNNVASTELKRGRKRSRKSQGYSSREESKCSPLPPLVIASENKIERLKISNTDATILLNEKNIKVFKTDSKAASNISANCTSENEHTAHESVNSGRSESSSRRHGSNRRMRRKRRSRKFKYFLRKLSAVKKEDPHTPSVILISQGTQATSADIRRAVRRIRRVTAQVRRPISSIPKSGSSSSSKISAKMIVKKPITMDPPPETFDKATSTSDPLLEDDAVQTLQLSSSTLLSFTIVSCGISDLIIDRCPKIFHIEVQACRILKKFQMNYCPSMKRLNISQCPKLSICALVSSVLTLATDSYLLVSYEPCMQGYHPGDGEKAILSKTALNQSVLLCHDFYDVSDESIQASFKEKLLEWLRHLFRLHATLNYTREKTKRRKIKFEEPSSSGYPWTHDLRRIHGQYVGPALPEFCCTEGRYDLLTNNPVFGEIFETHNSVKGFPSVNDCEACGDNSFLSYEAVEKYFKMQKKFIGFYIPITENNRTNIYD